MRSSLLPRSLMFFLFAIGFSWVFTVPLAISGVDLDQSSGAKILFALGGLGPTVSALLRLYLFDRGAKPRQFWRRLWDVDRIPYRWLAAVLFLVPVITLAAALLDSMMAGSGLQLERASEFLEQPLLLLPFALFTLIFGPLPEELGWRGYGLDRLQRSGWLAGLVGWRALTASLIVGVVWAVWHLPLFFISGTYQHGLGFGTTPFWFFMLSLVVSSILYTWIFNNTSRSTLAAVLYHFMQNFTGELFELSAGAEAISFWLTLGLAAVVVLVWGPGQLVRGENIRGNRDPELELL